MMLLIRDERFELFERPEWEIGSHCTKGRALFRFLDLKWPALILWRDGIPRWCEGRQPCTTLLAIMQWMPFEPFTVCVTRRSAARLQSV